jgi:hypothetical protein
VARSRVGAFLGVDEYSGRSSEARSLFAVKAGVAAVHDPFPSRDPAGGDLPGAKVSQRDARRLARSPLSLLVGLKATLDATRGAADTAGDVAGKC